MRQTRQHRLPQRLDYVLIPPPLDLSKPIVDDKAALPAIIVTPSSPSCDMDFRIAFLAPEPKPSLISRVFTSLHINAPAPQLKARSLLLIILPLIILACHVLTHSLAARRPHLVFDAHTQGGQNFGGSHAGGAAAGSGWFDLNDYWTSRHARDFVIVEPAS